MFWVTTCVQKKIIRREMAINQSRRPHSSFSGNCEEGHYSVLYSTASQITLSFTWQFCFISLLNYLLFIFVYFFFIFFHRYFHCSSSYEKMFSHWWIFLIPAQLSVAPQFSLKLVWLKVKRKEKNRNDAVL